MSGERMFRVLVRLGWVTGLAAVVLQALAFFGGYFQANLDSDFLYPFIVARDVLEGRYPLSGWTLSSAPYFVPDFLGLATLLAVFESGPAALAAYAVASALAMALLAGWTLHRAGVSRDSARLAGVAIVNVLLVCRGFGDHGRYLAWLLMPCFHGGAVMAGLVLVGWWLGPVREAPGRACRWASGAVLFLAGLSDTLVFTQFMLPLLAAMVAAAGRDWRKAARVQSGALLAGTVLLGVVAVRALAPALGWVHFSKVLRYAPTPGAVAGSAVQLVRDFATVIAPNAPGFVALGIVSGAAVAFSAWRRGGEPRPEVSRIAVWFGGLCLASTLAMPVASVYWMSCQHARLILPCLVIPGWWAVLAWTTRARILAPRFLASLSGLAAAAFVAAGLVAARHLERDAFAWPYPEPIAALDAVLPAQGHTHGLGDFWHAHLFNTLSRAGLRLSQIRPDGRVHFWNNNAFHHFDAGRDGTPGLVAPTYSFIVLGGLEPAAIEAAFGAPSRTIELAGETVWLYDPPTNGRLDRVEREIRERLGSTTGRARLPAEVPPGEAADGP